MIKCFVEMHLFVPLLIVQLWHILPPMLPFPSMDGNSEITMASDQHAEGLLICIFCQESLLQRAGTHLFFTNHLGKHWLGKHTKQSIRCQLYTKFYRWISPFLKSKSINNLSQYLELSMHPFMHEYDPCNHKSNNTPNRDSETLQSITYLCNFQRGRKIPAHHTNLSTTIQPVNFMLTKIYLPLGGWLYANHWPERLQWEDSQSEHDWVPKRHLYHQQ